MNFIQEVRRLTTAQRRRLCQGVARWSDPPDLARIFFLEHAMTA
jgi:hypothetical protein